MRDSEGYTHQESHRLALSIGNHVNSKKEALEFGDSLLQESLTFANVANTQGEFVEEYKHVKISTIKVTGPQPKLKDSPNLVYHAKIPIGMSSQKFYDFLVSVEGYKFIDPDADPNDFNKPIFGPFYWNDNSVDDKNCADSGRRDGTEETRKHYCQVEYAKLETLPFFMTKQDYTILNLFDPTTKNFISGSCNYPQVPGLSPYDLPHQKEAQKDGNNCVRMGFWGSYMVQEAIDNNDDNRDDASLDVGAASCMLVVSQWIDMNGKVPPWFNNFANLQWFHTFIDRAQDRFPINNKGIGTTTKNNDTRKGNRSMNLIHLLAIFFAVLSLFLLKRFDLI